jgi:hypothetical protein
MLEPEFVVRIREKHQPEKLLPLGKFRLEFLEILDKGF